METTKRIVTLACVLCLWAAPWLRAPAVPGGSDDVVGWADIALSALSLLILFVLLPLAILNTERRPGKDRLHKTFSRRLAP